MQTLEELKKAVFDRQEILAKIYSAAGSKSVFDYVQSWQVAEASELSKIFTQAAQRLLLQIYPKELALPAAEQLQKLPLVSTIDHHGILNHPFFINSNLIYSLKKDLNYLICLTTSGVSLNNSSWPGCLVLTADGNLKRFSFFADKVKTQSVFSVPALGPKNVDKLLSQITSNSQLDKIEKEKLHNLIEEIFTDHRIYEQANFSRQASLISTALWSKFFPEAPKLIYLPVEDLVTEILIKIILPDTGHVLNKLFFTSPGWGLIEKYFSGSLGAFSSSHKGSFLFWGIDNKHRRIHLSRMGDRVEGGELRVDLTHDAIANGLLKGRLYPTSLVCFLILLYYGITCLGGFNQVNWLTSIKEKFLQLLAELGELDSVERIANIPTENFAEANLGFLIKSQQIIKATGIDLYLNGADDYQHYENLAQILSVGESLESLLPEMYRVIVPAKDRQSNLLNLSDEAIAEQNGMASKIRQALI